MFIPKIKTVPFSNSSLTGVTTVVPVDTLTVAIEVFVTLEFVVLLLSTELLLAIEWFTLLLLTAPDEFEPTTTVSFTVPFKITATFVMQLQRFTVALVEFIWVPFTVEAFEHGHKIVPASFSVVLLLFVVSLLFVVLPLFVVLLLFAVLLLFELAKVELENTGISRKAEKNKNTNPKRMALSFDKNAQRILLTIMSL